MSTFTKQAEVLKRWRKSAGLTQKEAAKVLGYKSPISIAYFETGKRKVPLTVLKLIQCLAVKQ